MQWQRSIMAFRKTGFILALLAGVWCFRGTAYAAEADYQSTQFTVEGFEAPARISDGNRTTYSRAETTATVTVTSTDGIEALYIEFDRLPNVWTLQNADTGESVICGQNGFLHEYVSVTGLFGSPAEKLILEFQTDTVVADVYGFGEGVLPDWVQMWQPPLEEADLLLISSHSDDEQLFFLGVLPYYAGERGLKVQVAYVVQHFEANQVQNHVRPHEQLDGLWTVGVRNYPVMSEFPDLYAESKDRDTAFSQAVATYEKAGYTYDDFAAYITKCFRRFKPLVVVSHDLDGEYGHGTHVVCAKAITQAIEQAADESAFPDSAAEYGTWQPEKVYLHLYQENQIVMDYDIPLAHFDGKTAFQVSGEGFDCHKSQHWTWFYKWIYGTSENPITKASQIKNYSPCRYGLYASNVGADVAGGDFFENVVTYEEREEIQRTERLEQIKADIETLGEKIKQALLT